MLPKILLSRWKMILWNDFDAVFWSISHPRKGSFRINTLKTDGADIFQEFKSKNIKTVESKFLSGVYFYDRSQDFLIKGTNAFYAGKIYLQSIASLLPALVLEPKSWESILDVCAAPGSKTTQIAVLMENHGAITALEQNQIRYDKLLYNCRLQGATIVEWKKMDARHFLANAETPLFDRILLDAPCSAEGRINLSNEKTYGFWTLENIEKKATLQYELLSVAVKKLKKWGTLVYSTCTLAPEENEWVIARLLKEYKSLSLESIDIWISSQLWWREGVTSFDGINYGEVMKKAVRILPSDETEWFFVVKISYQ